MKVRLSDAMVRFRLTRDEVEALSSGNAVFLSMPLRPTSLTVRLEPVPESTPAANARGGLRVGIPAEWLKGWPASDTVGFDFDVSDASEGTILRVIVEKDFPCAHDGSGPPKPVRMP